MRKKGQMKKTKHRKGYVGASRMLPPLPSKMEFTRSGFRFIRESKTGRRRLVVLGEEATELCLKALKQAGAVRGQTYALFDEVMRVYECRWDCQPGRLAAADGKSC